MKNITVSLSFLFLTPIFALTQHTLPARLKVFIDCSSTWCDLQHIRSEINLVDFLFDNAQADVHVLITSQGTGSGGNEHRLVFFGGQYFRNQTDTLHFNVGPDATEFETRDLLLKYLKAGLIPFIWKTPEALRIEINLWTTDTTATGTRQADQSEDPWNAWVMRIGLDGFLNEDANYKSTYYGISLSANRITEETKTGGGILLSRNNSSFKLAENDTTETLVVANHNWRINHYRVKSINDHWSWAYEIKYSQNTFSNNKGRTYLQAAAEYNIFPYKVVNHKLLTLSYGLTARRNAYYHTTIYDKTHEMLYGHMATVYLSMNQKWGNSYTGIRYHNYFHNWKLFNLGVEAYANVRITGGLSVFIFAFGGLTRDQVFLERGDATAEEVLVRRRQLVSGYNYLSNVGITYRFGSKLNNVVNPRFDRSSSLNED